MWTVNPLHALIATGLLLVLAVLLALLLSRRTAVARDAHSATAVTAQEIGATQLGAQATLVQFSTEFCTKCPGNRRLLQSVADAHPDVEVIDVDLTHRADLARRFDVMQTPTTLVLDSAGVPTVRFTGVVKRADISDRLDHLTLQR